MDNITLKYTVNLMLSDDYKDRFKAEYFQTLIRWRKLNETIVKLEAGTLEYESESGLHLLKTQAHDMLDYLNTLEARAYHEEIDLTWQG